jgi:hypothetical protein
MLTNAALASHVPALLAERIVTVKDARLKKALLIAAIATCCAVPARSEDLDKNYPLPPITENTSDTRPGRSLAALGSA